MRRRCVLLVVAVMSLWACDRNTEFAKDLLKKDLVKVINKDPISIIGYTEYDTNANTNKVDSAYLGNIYNDIFGKTSAGCAMQLRVVSPDAYVEKDNNFQIDSVWMVMKVDLKTSIYDSLTYKKGKVPSQKVKVFSLNNNISSMTKSSEIVGDIIGDNIVENEVAVLDYNTPVKAIQKIRYYDKTKNSNNDLTLDKVIKIKLKNSFGAKLLSGAKSDYENQAAFLKKFFGIVISPDYAERGDGLYKFKPSSTVITVHYSKGPAGKRDTLLVPFVVTGNSVMISKYNYVHSSEIKTAVENKFSDKLYIQGGSGLKSMIKLPHELFDTNTGKPNRYFNKAALELKVILGSENPKVSHLPKKLTMVAFNSEGTPLLIKDNIVKASFFDGSYNSKEKKYVLNMAYFMQEVANSANLAKFYEKTKIDLSKGFAIYVDNRRSDPRSVVIDGKSLKFTIIYTDTER